MVRERLMEQRTEEWFAARLGKVTASKVADVLAKTKTGVSASRANYLSDLVVERLTGQQAEFYQNDAMQWGTDTEPQARMAYEAHKNVLVDEEGFIDHPSIANFGCSPDGLVGADGLIEIKCPNSKTHIDTLLSGKAPSKYIPQMQSQMAVTGRQYCDFVSFDPRLPEDLQLFVIRVDRDNEYIANLEEEVVVFLNEVEETVTKLKGLKDGSQETTKS
jgi:putative phage-type endonuclease